MEINSSERPPVFEIKPDEFPKVLSEINGRLESERTSDALLQQIRMAKAEADRQGLKSPALELTQTEYIAGQHELMEEMSKIKKASVNPIRMAEGFLISRNALNEMVKRANEDDGTIDVIVKARVPRFQGREADKFGQHKKAEDFYHQSLSLFESLDFDEGKHNRLELMGFIAFSKFRQGEKTEALEITNGVIRDFNESDEGKWLKRTNPNMWASWLFGIERRMADCLVSSKKPEDKESVRTMVQSIENILTSPDVDKSLLFHRIKEHEELKSRIR